MLRQRRSLHVILDFDGTITQIDTTAILGSITNVTGTHATKSWDAILEAYLHDYGAHEAAYTPKQHLRTTLLEESTWLRSLRPIELNSVSRVERAGVFRGATTDSITTLARQSLESGAVKLRYGCINLFELPRAIPNAKLSIISVNWSRTFIKQTLLAEARREPGSDRPELEHQINQMPIYANEIEGLTEPRGSDGKLGSIGGIRTSGDKLEVFGSVRSSRAAERLAEDPEQQAGNGDQNVAPLVVYVGDSTSDLECLVAANVGICVRDEDMGTGQKELASCLDRLGITTRPLEELTSVSVSALPALWWTSSLASVAEVLRKL